MEQNKESFWRLNLDKRGGNLRKIGDIKSKKHEYVIYLIFL